MGARPPQPGAKPLAWQIESLTAIIRYYRTMADWLNYHHLLYFWLVAREGSLAGASRELQLAQSTVSGQIRAL